MPDSPLGLDLPSSSAFPGPLVPFFLGLYNIGWMLVFLGYHSSPSAALFSVLSVGQGYRELIMAWCCFQVAVPGEVLATLLPACPLSGWIT